MTPIRKGTSKRLGLNRPSLPDEPYAFVSLAFPAPEGATAWRCRYRHCNGGRGTWERSAELAVEAAKRHHLHKHVLPKGVTVAEAAANLKHALGL